MLMIGFYLSMSSSSSLQVWDDVSGLTFREVADSSSVDIRIKFGSYEHGDGISFDGQGGVLAHAFLPRNGDAHFDDSERWTIGTNSGKKSHDCLRFIPPF